MRFILAFLVTGSIGLTDEAPSKAGGMTLTEKRESFSNQVSIVSAAAEGADIVTQAIAANDTNLIAAAIVANQTNLIAAAIALNETNLIIAVKADDEAGDLQSDNTVNILEEPESLFRFYFTNGVNYEIQRVRPENRHLLNAVLSRKRRITGHLSARLHLDGGLLKGNGGIPDPKEETDLRRLRLATYGRTDFVRPLTYGVSFDVTEGDFYLKDGYMWLHNIPYVKSFKFGVFKPPVSLSYLQSSSTMPMMENAAPVSAFTPGHRVGFQLGGNYFDGRGTLHTGFFGGKVDSDESDSSKSYSRFVNRATWLPVYEQEDMHFVHVGLSLNHQFAQADDTRFRARPESYLSDYLVDTGPHNGDTITICGFESAWAKESISCQTETFLAVAEDESGASRSLWGGYVMGSIILTGESRPYNTDSGTFGRLKPNQDFSIKKRHLGALELTTRMSYIDLNDGNIEGGEMTVLSTGLNCYLTRQNRIMFIIGMADVNNTSPEGELYFVQSRFQVEF